jgi:hypothetical protein
MGSVSYVITVVSMLRSSTKEILRFCISFYVKFPIEQGVFRKMPSQYARLREKSHLHLLLCTIKNRRKRDLAAYYSFRT